MGLPALALIAWEAALPCDAADVAGEHSRWYPSRP
jgi:hypothetical protein